jgi:VanZ family protein
VRGRPADGPADADAYGRIGARHLIWLWGPVIVYMAIIFSLSSQSSVPVGPQVSDKLLHFVAYLGLAVVVVRAVGRGLPARVGLVTAIAAWALTAGYGLLDEVHQMFVPGRVAAVDDLVADAVGALAGITLCWAWGKMSA